MKSIHTRITTLTCCCFLFLGILIEALAQAPSLEVAFSSPVIFLFTLFNMIFMSFTLGHLYAYHDNGEKNL